MIQGGVNETEAYERELGDTKGGHPKWRTKIRRAGQQAERRTTTAKTAARLEILVNSRCDGCLEAAEG
ncbi:hypothetical protein M408DRAFT_274212 [Serendipita vermifera MAFF 305830]|uniref:Uncharacterized protein n=1 Tax=Serendipita vermifera MAFF 305830 TaxID=933852 RepID=A0A0C2WY38_SERVB|nr:hypothetical protein M408DRAFT_274212 [Serendipita vermifera MAFF 305830]